MIVHNNMNNEIFDYKTTMQKLITIVHNNMNSEIFDYKTTMHIYADVMDIICNAMA